MKSKLWSHLFCVLLAVCIGVGGIGCMVTAFKMTAVSLPAVAIFCVLLAVLLTYWMLGGKNVLVLFGTVVGTIILLLDGGGKTILRSLGALLYELSSAYDSGYGWGVLGSPGNTIDGVPSFTPGLCVIAGLVVLAVTFTVGRRKTAIPAVAAALLPLGSCLVLTDTVPANWAIFLLLMGLVLLLLTHTVRRRSQLDGNRLMAMLLVPVLLLDMLLLWAVPREGYKAQQNQLQIVLSDWFWELPFVPGGPKVPGGVGNTENPLPSVVQGMEVDLGTLGRNYQSNVTVMYVTAQNDGVLYLRGQAYDVYTGTKWQVRENLEGSALGWLTKDLQAVQSVGVRTVRIQKLRYFPYYVQRDSWLEDYQNGRLSNTGLNQMRVYTYIQAEPTPGQVLAEEDRLTDALYDHYTEIPAYTNQQAQVILSGMELDDSLSVEEKAETIADYVRQTAAYDLKTDRMPEDQQDFAIWFLEEGTTGYCIHFATAATVLLRAAGVPCRYVTGYMVYTQSGQEVGVPEKQSHAWVEYYDPDMGWRLLEPTPGDAQPQPPEVTEPPTEPSETTEPPATTEPSETTEPPESTGEQTKPSQQTRPTQTQQGTTDGGGTVSPEPDRTWILRILMWIGIAFGAVAVLWLQMVLRRRRRYRRMHTGKANKQALARWQEVRRFCRILKEETPEDLERLAEKAKFSQHRLTEEERGAFDQWLAEARQRLREKKGRLFYRLFWAV